MRLSTLQIGPRNVAEVDKCRAFSDGVLDLAKRLNVPVHCFADVLCVSQAALADMDGLDPIAKLQRLEALQAATKAHLINLMTGGGRPQ